MNLLDTDIVIRALTEEGTRDCCDLDHNADRGFKRTKSFDVLALDSSMIENYCRLYQKLRGEGVALPDADLLIAATAISVNMTLESRDEHFEINTLWSRT